MFSKLIIDVFFLLIISDTRHINLDLSFKAVICSPPPPVTPFPRGDERNRGLIRRSLPAAWGQCMFAHGPLRTQCGV